MTWLANNWQQVLGLAGSHLLLALPAILLSLVIALPIGRFAEQSPRIGRPLLGLTTLLYAIPALPLLIFVPAIFGFPLRSSATLITVLTIYGVALMVRTVADAFAAIDSETRRAAVAVGHSPRSLFWQVDFPLAVPMLLSGLRVVAVSTIGLVTIGALIGIPSLGLLLTDGFQRGITASVITGLAATAVMALLVDSVLLLVGRLLTPWERVGQSRTRRQPTWRLGSRRNLAVAPATWTPISGTGDVGTSGVVVEPEPNTGRTQ